MSQTERTTEELARSAPSNPNSVNFAGIGEKSLEELVAWQSEQWEQIQKANRNWVDRIQSEVKLASELSNKLTAARSMPEFATACQEWTSRHMEMAAEDANRIVADGQKLVEAGTRLLTNGWQPKISGASS